MGRADRIERIGADLQGNADTGPPRDSATSELMSVVIAARDEENYIGACIDALLAQDERAGAVEIIVAANACRDATVARALERADGATARGWRLKVLDLATPGKPVALNAADAEARGDMRVYLDADVRCSPRLLGLLRAALEDPAPRYATGRLTVDRAKSWVTQRYAAFWVCLPFVRGGATGAGLFAVNVAGRARWGAFPAIISDDTYARLQFEPQERVEVDADYIWPMVEGFAALVRVRRRQDAGVLEVLERYPQLQGREGKARLGLAGLAHAAVRAPLGFLVYGLVYVAVRLRPKTSAWTRGR